MSQLLNSNTQLSHNQTKVLYFPMSLFFLIALFLWPFHPESQFISSLTDSVELEYGLHSWSCAHEAKLFPDLCQPPFFSVIHSHKAQLSLFTINYLWFLFNKMYLGSLGWALFESVSLPMPYPSDFCIICAGLPCSSPFSSFWAQTLFSWHLYYSKN